MSAATEITVVGSINIDLSIPVSQLPRPGETLLGGNLRTSLGGKGANQAVASARLGRRTALIACVGNDSEGSWAAEQLEHETVSLAGLSRRDLSTGTAIVFVLDGESSIVVSPGANAALSVDEIETNVELLKSSRAVLAQLEVPVATVLAAARATKGTFILNPAPAQALPHDVLELADVIVPNRIELATLTSSPVPTSVDEAAELARSLATDARIVVTLGADGALAIERAQITHVLAGPARVVDATAAGDSFCAALADALLDGASLAEAATWANEVAAVTVTRPGAIDALPRRAEVLARRLEHRC